MKRETFTSDDWDYIMKTHPDLRDKYNAMMEFDIMNPNIAEAIDTHMKKILKKDANQTTD